MELRIDFRWLSPLFAAMRGSERIGSIAAARSAARLREAAGLPVDALLAELASSPDGLLHREVDERLQEHGLNVAVREARHRPVVELARLFASPLTFLLLVLATVSWEIGETKGAIVISLMVALAVALTFVQEFRSSRAAERLRAMVSTTATVLRRDRRAGVPEEVNRVFQVRLTVPASAHEEVAIERLVPGEIVRLSAGDMIPADLRIIAAKDLFVNQSALTGEALPVEKFESDPHATAKGVLEISNLCFMGTNVVSGTATAAVVATGSNTYFGSVAAGLAQRREPTSFDKGVNRFTWLMIRFMLVMVPLVFLVNGLTKGDWMEAFLFAVAVAVGLTPEMLPMIVTLNLAKGAMALSRRKVIVKRLNAIQNFGAMDVLCTDKTGTLTQDRVILEKHVDLMGEESARVLEYAYLNSYHQTGLRNLLDKAVLEHVEVCSGARASGVWRKVDEIPFDFQRRRMSVVVQREAGRDVLICKGAVEEVFAVCSKAEIDGREVELAAPHLSELRETVTGLNEDGFRVIAVAYREFAPGRSTYSVADEQRLTLAGYIAFLDPPKDSAAPAIAALNRFGVTVKILTGDNEIVTGKICREVGLPVDRILLGNEVEALSDQQLAEQARHVAVFAKLSPAQKARVIHALHRNNHVVGFLGDGINDGPALKAADVGISVDSAVDIAKESADIILLEKSLLVLEEGVIEGRKVFGNIVKYVKMTASSNFGNMFSVVGASAFLPFLPLAPVQVLLNNLAYDFSQTAVATDEVDVEYLEKPRQWDIGAIARFMLIMGPLSSVFDYATFFCLLHAFGGWSAPGVFQTGWFLESLLSQTLVVHVIRTGRIPFLQSRPSTALLLSTLAICAIGVWLPYSGFGHAWGFTPLPVTYFYALAAILVSYFVVTQLVKTWLIRRFGVG
jgi:Mg2+-importing ATPase